jgi:hypothetical protein
MKIVILKRTDEENYPEETIHGYIMSVSRLMLGCI